MYGSPVVLPVVWSKEGPVQADGPRPSRRVQINLPLLSCSKSHIDSSKLHVMAMLNKTMKVHVTNCSTCAFSCFNANQCTPHGQTQTFIKLKICCHRNKTASLIIHLQLYFSAFQNRSRQLFPPIAALIFVKFEQDLWERSRDILAEVFMVRNPFKTGQYWCSAVIYRKPNAFSIISFF